MNSKKSEARSEHIGAYVRPTLKEQVYELAAKRDLSASDVIREALHTYTSQHAA